MSQEVREPQQKRSIDKKNRIIEAGYELFAKDGYFNTNTSEIAKKAGVSTGIVYGYFHDKRDILIEVLDIYVDNMFYPVFEMFDKITAPVDFDCLSRNYCALLLAFLCATTAPVKASPANPTSAVVAMEESPSSGV